MSQYGVGKKDGLCMNMEMPSPGTGGRHRFSVWSGKKRWSMYEYGNA